MSAWGMPFDSTGRPAKKLSSPDSISSAKPEIVATAKPFWHPTPKPQATNGGRRNARVQADLVDRLCNSSEKRLARILLLLAQFGKESKPEIVVPNISQETGWCWHWIPEPPAV